MGGAHTEPVLTTVRGVVLRGVFVFPARNAGEGPSSPGTGGRTEEEAKRNWNLMIMDAQGEEWEGIHR